MFSLTASPKSGGQFCSLKNWKCEQDYKWTESCYRVEIS